MHEDFLFVSELVAVGLHREAEHHEGRLLERLNRRALRGQRRIVDRRRGRRTQELVLQRSRRRDDRQLVLCGALGEHAGNQEAIDLVGAFENPVHARVPVVALGGVVLHVAVAAVNLNVLVEREVERLAARDLRD